MTTKFRELPKELNLISGMGEAPNGGPGRGCVMNWVAWKAGEAWSDQPACACPVLTAFCISWNDGMNDGDRQILLPYIDRLIGSRSTKEVESRRAWMATDRDYTEWIGRQLLQSLEVRT